MLFNSYPYIFIFLPFSFFIYFYLLKLKSKTGAKLFLVSASLFFYSWWNVIYLPLILLSMIFNYMIGTKLNSNFKNKKNLLIVGIVSNVLLLSYFKYSDFFIENFNFLLNTNINLLHLALPLAISFFTFQQIAYLVDSYRQETKEYDFLNYAVFVTFFPQLIAGPIVHHREMMPQFKNVRNQVKNYKNIAVGLFIFSIGLFKKVVIADSFAVWANSGFDVAETLSFFEAWVTSLSYTFQLYFDFSGYTDMAIGIALLFNIKLPINFNAPYKATSIQDFWRRWHITLSRFLKDYIYIPLGGNRKGEVRTYTNLFATFLLAGIWHGAGWTFVLWGALHGAALVIHRAWHKLGFKMHSLLGWFITFNFVNVSWVFFRANSFDDASKVLKGMFGLSQIGYLTDLITFGGIDKIDFLILIFLFIFVISSFFLKNSNELGNSFKSNTKTMTWTAFAFAISILHFSKISTFLYFNF